MTDKQKRDEAVDEFAKAMKARLDWAADAGKTGWDGEYSADALRSEILEDAEDMDFEGKDGKAVDIANRCMMLWYREQSNARREFPSASAGKLHGVVGSLKDGGAK